MTDHRFVRVALEKLGFRQKSYQQAFGIAGSPSNLALIDLADFCCAFRADVAGLSNDQLREMNGRRQAFFRIWNHLHLSNAEMEQVYRPAIVRAATRLSQIETGE